MRRSATVKLLLVPLIALAACSNDQGCNDSTESTEIKHCVDDDGGVVEERLCEPSDGGQPESVADGSVTATELDAGSDAGFWDEPGPASSSTPHRTVYHWYYGGTRTVWAPGTRVSGGSYTPTVGKSYAGPSAISRGGFGSIGRGSPGAGS